MIPKVTLKVMENAKERYIEICGDDKGKLLQKVFSDAVEFHTLRELYYVVESGNLLAWPGEHLTRQRTKLDTIIEAYFALSGLGFEPELWIADKFRDQNKKDRRWHPFITVKVDGKDVLFDVVDKICARYKPVFKGEPEDYKPQKGLKVTGKATAKGIQHYRTADEVADFVRNMKSPEGLGEVLSSLQTWRRVFDNGCLVGITAILQKGNRLENVVRFFVTQEAVLCRTALSTDNKVKKEDFIFGADYRTLFDKERPGHHDDLTVGVATGESIDRFYKTAKLNQRAVNNLKLGKLEDILDQLYRSKGPYAKKLRKNVTGGIKHFLKGKDCEKSHDRARAFLLRELYRHERQKAVAEGKDHDGYIFPFAERIQPMKKGFDEMLELVRNWYDRATTGYGSIDSIVHAPVPKDHDELLAREEKWYKQNQVDLERVREKLNYLKYFFNHDPDRFHELLDMRLFFSREYARLKGTRTQKEKILERRMLRKGITYRQAYWGVLRHFLALAIKYRPYLRYHGVREKLFSMLPKPKTI
jgi:hypothetical protein